MVEMTLVCAVYGGSVFPVQIARDADVSTLKKAIFKEKRYGQRYNFDPSDMTLFMARKNDSWLKQEDARPVLRGQVDTEYIKMLTTRQLDHPAYFGSVSMSEREVIHILVALPNHEEADAKRPRIEETESLADLWLDSQLSLDSFPAVNELGALLVKPLPFRLKLCDHAVSTGISHPRGQLRHCEMLSSYMNAFVGSSNLPPAPDASTKTWQRYYDALFLITHALCSSKGLHLDMRRYQVDSTDFKRPDFMLLDTYLVLMRGVEKSALVDINEALGQLTHQMRRWSVVLYGDLPYILGYATSGDKFELVAIERRDSPPCRWTRLLSINILREKASALKVFYNLAFVLYEMASLTNRTYACGLQPFVPDINDKRTIEMLDGVIQRMITTHAFAYLVDRRKPTVSDRRQIHDQSLTPGILHLHFLHSLEVRHRAALCAHFAKRRVDVDESREVLLIATLLLDVLTALMFWHGRNYCHGDLNGRNVVLVPAAASSYWMLIDMDESHHPNTVTIQWNYQMNGHKLRFQHDLYQLGAMLNDLTYELPEEMKTIQATLLSAVDKPGITAETALVDLQTARE